MATKNFRSTVLEPTSEFAHGDKLRFTALATVGEVLKGSFSETTIGEDGVYSVDLQYGKHRIDYKPYEGVWRHFADVEVNADTLATTLQDLALASVPVTDEAVLVLQGILADAEAAKTAAETAETAAETALASIDSTVADVAAGYPSLLAAQLSKSVTVNATTGNDETADGSSAKPFKTIKAAVESQPDLIALTVNLAGGDTELTSHKIDSAIVCSVRKLKISCTNQHVTFSGDYIFSVSGGGSVIIQPISALHIHCTSATAILALAVGSIDCMLMNTRFYLNSDASFAFVGYTSLSGYTGISNLVTSNVSMISYADKTTPATYPVQDHSGLSGSVIATHRAGSFGSNYQNTASEAVIAGNLKAISK